MSLRAPALLACALLAAACPAAAASAQEQETFVPRDDQKSRSVHWNTHLIAPLVLSPDGSELFAVNQGGQRVAVFDTASLVKVADVPVGPAVVSMAWRPGTSELWLVDRVASTVSVLDTAARTLTHSIRVGAEPHGIAFTPNGDRAYVACSAISRVDVVATATYTVATSITVPGKHPRAIVHHQGIAWVAPATSGNNSAAMGAATSGPDLDKIVAVRSLADFPALNQLPDRDLFAIPTQPSPASDVLDPARTRTGLGTMLLNLHARPGTNELWIPNTEALNAVHKGERNFIAGQCVENRVTIVDATGAQPPFVVDLDQLAPAGLECAQPTGLAFDPVRPRVYVCGYGSDRVAVLDVSGGAPTWAGAIDIPFFNTYPKLAGPRAAIPDGEGNWLYVLNKGDTSLARVDLNALPAGTGFAVTAPVPIPLGFDTVAGAERFGRNDLVNGKNSKSGTTSCAACHLDGHTDGLAWDLGLFLDPEGTPNSQLAFPLDPKGPLVTQSVRRLFETAPYHWRGERANLRAFNAAFIGLLEREEDGRPADLGGHFSYLENYMRRVSYSPNPHQAADREPTSVQRMGAHLFMEKPVLGQMTCASCHTLPLGTSGEIVPSHAPGLFEVADVPQLRGLYDKLAPAFAIGGAFGTRNELGSGLSHGGAFPTVRDLLLAPDPAQPAQPAFNLTSLEADAIAEFLRALDTGLAPSTGLQVTANAANAATIGANELAYLTREAQKGNCDLIFRGVPELFGNRTVWPSGLYDPRAGTFRTAQAAAPPVTIAALLADAAAGRPVTFIGVPLWMGEPLALDRDLDGAFDLDEIALGTLPENGDTDGDKFPDGYELAHGMDPLAPGSVSPDVDPPALVGPTRHVYSTTNTIKFEAETSEVCRLLVSHDGGPPVIRLPLQADYDRRFSVILSLLEPGVDHPIQLHMTDPAGNVALAQIAYPTRPRALPTPVAVDDIALAIQGAPGAQQLAATVALLAGGQPPPMGYVVTADVHRQAPGGTVSALATGLQQTLTTSDGLVGFTRALPPPAGVASEERAPDRLWFVVRSVTPPAGAPFYARPLNQETWDAIDWSPQ